LSVGFAGVCRRALRAGGLTKMSALRADMPFALRHRHTHT